MRWFLILGLITTHSLAADFHVDPAGDDRRDGRSPESAWKTLARVEKQPLHPGDRIRLRAGVVHEGMLAVRRDGTEADPIRVDSYDTHAQRPHAIIHGGHLAMDASASHLVIENILFKADAPNARAGLMVYAHRPMTNITIRDCVFQDNRGRGIWISGEPNRTASSITITRNRFINTAGSPLQITRLTGGSIDHNWFENSCFEPVDDWQAAIRVWSSDIRDLTIAGNRIRNGIHRKEKAAGMGIHIDEVGPNVIVRDNDIFDCDASGIEVENTRGVQVENNWIDNTHTGIFLYRAGHDHTLAQNTVSARALGIVLQGHRAGGVNAGPEIEVDGQLFSGNQVRGNITVAKQWASLKIMGGAESGRTLIDGNDFGPARVSMFEWGKGELTTVEAFERASGATNSNKHPTQNQKVHDRALTVIPNTGATRGWWSFKPAE